MKIELYRGDPYTSHIRHSERAKKQNLTTTDAVGLDPDRERKKRQQDLHEQLKNKTNSTHEDDDAPHPVAGELSSSEGGHIDVVV